MQAIMVAEYTAIGLKKLKILLWTHVRFNLHLFYFIFLLQLKMGTFGKFQCSHLGDLGTY